MKLRIRVLDMDTRRLLDAEKTVRAAARKAGVQVDVLLVGDHLEISRFGLLGALPAVEINGRIVNTGKPVEMKEIETIIRTYISNDPKETIN